MAGLDEKLVVITGASRGIGAAAAFEFAAEGASVILIARTQNDLDKRVAEIREAGGKAFALAADLSVSKSVTAAAEQIISEHGVPDILVNNAGLGRWLYVHETPPEEAEMMIKLPFLAAFWMTSAFLPGMLERKSGRILNVNSPVSIITWGGAAGYASSRWALRGMTESLRIDLYKTGVTVCHCLFGETDSEYFKANPGAHERLPSLAKYSKVLTPKQVGRGLVKASTKRTKRFYRPFSVIFYVFCMTRFPSITRLLLRITSYRKRS